MKSFPDSPGYGNYESSLNSFVQNSSSLLHQMQQLQGAGGGGGSVIKFPELSITKHEGRGGGDSAGLQIIQKQNNQKLSADQQDKPSVDIQDQINMLRNMPDFMRINPNTITTEEEDISGDEEEDEDGSPPPAAAEGHKVGSAVCCPLSVKPMFCARARRCSPTRLPPSPSTRTPRRSRDCG